MEVDFGDSELFEQFDSDTPLAKHIRFTDDEEDAPDLRERVEECEETITRLKTENEELKRKLKLLNRPAGIGIVNSKVDGPLCQILFGNNSISKQCRQDIEDYVVSLIHQHQFQQNNGQEASALHPQPQNSSFVMEENQETNAEASVGKHIRDAFCVVGSVLYFTSFCLDKLGQPLLNENPQLTEGWDVPKYQQVFGQVIALEGQEVQIKEKRPKPCCFNCGAEDHQLRDCPKHLDRPGNYARILFVDFSSAFNTIIPDLLQTKLMKISVPTPIGQWITNFLTDRQQQVRLGTLTSGSLTISPGAPQGCVLSPLLFSLYTNDCTATDPSVKLLKFAEDTTVIGLISDGDESAYRQEVEQLAVLCSLNNLELNTLKTVEMVVDFRRNPPALPPLTSMDSTVATVESFRFLDSTIFQDLKWERHIDSIVKKAQQRLFFLRQLRKYNPPQELLTQFYSTVIESPKDMARINEKRKEFAQVNQGNITSNQRYHAEEVEERFAKYKPGVVSKELLDALGIVANTLPPFIYRMRELGYPPGWLKEAEMENSGLMLYDGKTSGEEDSNGPNQNVCYDVSKLVDFPGFNVSAPPNVRDDFRSFSSIPMQPQHWKPTFAAQLSNMYPAPDSKCMKRCHEPESTPQQTKKRRSNSDFCRSSDMDTDSDHDTPKQDRYDDFQFQPPLPPGSPLISTPPPLPLGTPPVTPTPPPLPKGTPPPTPPINTGSPVLSGRNGAGCEESEDGLTLEELEEQQRLLWAALESADNGNSDSDTGAAGTPAMGSPRESPLAEPDAGSEEGVEESGLKAEEISDHDHELSSTPASPGEVPMSSADEDKSSNGQANDSFNEDTGAVSCDELIVLDEITQSNDSDPEKNRISEVPEEKTSTLDAQATEENVGKKITGVPHRSKFAEGIIPFEDTPEFTEVAEATGVYLKIRDLLKESPRNQAKNKKSNS
ncbi:hypothetical protein QTP70_018710 [Hemibagrus guttatus]|uniref:Zinc finger CCHC domain-containing protein 8 n=1 Tax=Hemibagrus guttatus TaxID=175788 RepID=A0AAE0Q7J9_9TELE|nr:hypothetical protein QTP70_018710 [Hemibagrus guttatus]KAK3539142.1 hypothetical protein QTP86_026976 [Hemibagrus guttatus]